MRDPAARMPVCYFPDTGQPVPAVLTVEDLIRFLWLNEVGVKNPRQTINAIVIWGCCVAFRSASASCCIWLMS